MAKALILGGATGLLGRPLAAELAARGWETQCLGRQDGDIEDFKFLETAIQAANPDIIFNAIAWTQVDDAEDHAEEAARINRCLPDSLARIASSMPNVWLGHFSTDFVFNSKPGIFMREEDEPNPGSVYGKTKLEGEQAILRNLPERSCILRTAWLFGPGRKNFVDTILAACKKRDLVNVVDDQGGSPTYTLDLAKWAADLAEKRQTGIWHCVNSGRASWCELATEAIQLTSGPCRVAPITSKEWPQKAPRPVNSALDNSKLAAFLGKKPRPWPQALRDYLFGEYQDGLKELKS